MCKKENWRRKKFASDNAPKKTAWDANSNFHLGFKSLSWVGPLFFMGFLLFLKGKKTDLGPSFIIFGFATYSTQIWLPGIQYPRLVGSYCYRALINTAIEALLWFWEKKKWRKRRAWRIILSDFTKQVRFNCHTVSSSALLYCCTDTSNNIHKSRLLCPFFLSHAFHWPERLILWWLLTLSKWHPATTVFTWQNSHPVCSRLCQVQLKMS